MKRQRSEARRKETMRKKRSQMKGRACTCDDAGGGYFSRKRSCHYPHGGFQR
jgi:hypothetical protein